MYHRPLFLTAFLLAPLWPNAVTAQPVIPPHPIYTPASDNHSSENPMKLSLSGSWTNATIKLTGPAAASAATAKSAAVEVPAKLATYQGASGDAKGKKSFYAALIVDPSTKKTYIARAAWPGLNNVFYVSNTAGLVAYEVGPGVLTWEDSYVSQPASGSPATAIAQFEADFDAAKLSATMLNSAMNNKIFLSAASPQYFFSDKPSTSGALPIPVIDEVAVADNTLKLTLHNSITNKAATYWIDLKARKVTKSIVDGQEMDLTTGKPYAEPLTKPKN